MTLLTPFSVTYSKTYTFYKVQLYRLKLDTGALAIKTKPQLRVCLIDNGETL